MPLPFASSRFSAWLRSFRALADRRVLGPLRRTSSPAAICFVLARIKLKILRSTDRQVAGVTRFVAERPEIQDAGMSIKRGKLGKLYRSYGVIPSRVFRHSRRAQCDLAKSALQRFTRTPAQAEEELKRSRSLGTSRPRLTYQAPKFPTPVRSSPRRILFSSSIAWHAIALRFGHATANSYRFALLRFCSQEELTMSRHLPCAIAHCGAGRCGHSLAVSLCRQPSRPSPGLLRAVFASRPVLQLLRAAGGLRRLRRDGGRDVHLARGRRRRLVGHTYITYQPLMPHEFLYRHHRCYYRDNGPYAGVTKTWVCWW